MSTKAVRDKIRTFLGAELPSEKYAEMDGGYENLADFLSSQKNTVTDDPTPIAVTDDWIGLQYLADQETAVSLNANNSTGRYRETGVISLHVVSKAKVGTWRGILTRCEAIQDLFRGRNISGVIVKGIIPANFANGTTLDFAGGGYVSATVSVIYEYDRNL